LFAVFFLLALTLYRPLPHITYLSAATLAFHHKMWRRRKRCSLFASCVRRARDTAHLSTLRTGVRRRLRAASSLLVLTFSDIAARCFAAETSPCARRAGERDVRHSGEKSGRVNWMVTSWLVTAAAGAE